MITIKDSLSYMLLPGDKFTCEVEQESVLLVLPVRRMIPELDMLLDLLVKVEKGRISKRESHD